MALGMAGAVTASLVTCSSPLTELEHLQHRGTLKVASRYAATTYYLGREGQPTGLDYELARGFADHLGLELQFDVLERFDELLPALGAGEADVAAGHITATPERAHLVRFGPAYQFVSEYVVYRRGNRRPHNIEELAGGRLGVVAGSAHAETLRRMAASHPALDWEERSLASVEELFEAVDNGQLDFAITDSTAYALNRRYYPQVRRAFDIADPAPIAWAFPKTDDLSVFEQAQQYFRRLYLSGELDQLVATYYEHTDDFDWVGTRTFLRHLDTRLPRFEPLFRQASDEVGIDWLLLAAMAYQESHWDADAVSPTRVRGLMMLTEATAAQLGVDDRTSPEQSILGGARYLRQLSNRLPDDIPEPDRTWMALAAYNIGWGHVDDARTLTERGGDDPDRWTDVREYLPLLSRRQWYSQVRRGYARGRSAVNYVRNIHSYYDILLWKLGEPTLAELARPGASEMATLQRPGTDSAAETEPVPEPDTPDGPGSRDVGAGDDAGDDDTATLTPASADAATA
jgi:membrane-bound lytic murein transglycosylase F